MKLSKRAELVKAAQFRLLACVGLLALTSTTLAADTNPPAPPPVDDSAGEPAPDSAPPTAPVAPTGGDAADGDGPAPPIEAKIYDVAVVKHSKSNKIYVFNDSKGVNPSVGKLLLLKQGDESVMAFRIIKSYPDKSQFAAVKVRAYSGFTDLPSSQVYRAVEKLSDIAPPPPTAEQKADLKELETAPEAFTSKTNEEDILAYDPDLDAGSSPPPGGLNAETTKEENTDIGSDEDISVDEIETLDHYLNWLTLQLGILSSSVPDEAHPPLTRSTYFTGAGLRYARTLVKHPFLYSSKIQDSLALEGGAFYYRIVNLTGLGDSYTVLSPVVTLRYTVQLGETYGMYAYAGAFYHTVLSYTDASSDAVSTLQGAAPALGLGATFLIGPSWHLRIDAGIDIVALGLMLRY